MTDWKWRMRLGSSLKVFYLRKLSYKNSASRSISSNSRVSLASWRLSSASVFLPTYPCTKRLSRPPGEERKRRKTTATLIVRVAAWLARTGRGKIFNFAFVDIQFFYDLCPFDHQFIA
jgi:hypothetical protein